MRVLLVDRTARPGRRHGLLSTLVPYLEAAGHHCELMLRSGSAVGVLPTGRRAWWLPPLGAWAARRAAAVLRRCRIDVVSAYSPHVAQQVLPACVTGGVPLVMTILNATSLEPCRGVVSYASAIIALNRTTAEHIAAQRPDVADKIALLDKPIDLEIFHTVARPKDGPFRVVCLGRLSHTKGRRVLAVLEACAGLLELIPQLEVEVVGGGRWLRKVRACASGINRGAGRQVVWVVGDTTRPQDHLQRASVVVGAGFSAAEGLACGCQVIGLGFAGLFGLVTEQAAQQALDLNFGDTGARWPEARVDQIATELLAAYQRCDASLEWARRVVETRLAAPVAAGRIEHVLQQAAARRGHGG